MKYTNQKKVMFFLIIALLFITDTHMGKVNFELINSDKLEMREKVLNDVRENHHKVISDLITLAKASPKLLIKSDSQSNQWRDSKHISIMILGDLRAVEAIPILISNLEYMNPRSLVFEGSMGVIDYMYPAAEALAKIGMPAINPVIEKLGIYDKDCQGRKNCVWIIQKVLGIKLGRYKLQLAIEETKDEKVKKNLQAVLPKFKTLQEKLNAERARRDKKKQKQK